VPIQEVGATRWPRSLFGPSRWWCRSHSGHECPDVIEGDPKSDAGGRTVPLDAGTVAALRAHRRAQLAERLAWGPAWVDSGKVFTRENGEPLHPAMISDRFHDLVVAADLPPVRLHDLRHGAASLMLVRRVASGATTGAIRRTA
jgi:integrase